jgi:hypothetical protein
LRRTSIRRGGKWREDFRDEIRRVKDRDIETRREEGLKEWRTT